MIENQGAIKSGMELKLFGRAGVPDEDFTKALKVLLQVDEQAWDELGKWFLTTESFDDEALSKPRQFFAGFKRTETDSPPSLSRLSSYFHKLNQRPPRYIVPVRPHRLKVELNPVVISRFVSSSVGPVAMQPGRSGTCAL